MTPEASASDKADINRAMEASIHIGLAVLLAIACLMILKPFLPLIAWGIIIGVASYPAFLKMQHVLGGRGGLAAVLYTLILLAIVIIPVVLLAQSLVEGVKTLTAHMKDGTLAVPAPPDSVAGWPIIGQHHEGSPVSHLVHHRWPDGQFAEAAAAGAGRRGSHRCRVSGGDRRIRGHGIIGLFVGAIVLSVGYKLFVAWIEPDTVEEQSA